MGFTVLAKVKDEERHLSEVVCLLYHQNKLYSGADDGKIKVWSEDLKLIKEIDAHAVNIYSLAASNDTLYSCSNDGSLKAWSISSWELKKSLVESGNEEILRLHFTDGKLYSGDDKGNVLVWENDELVGKYEVGEEVWDLMVCDNLLFTVRNLDVSIIEMRPGGKQYTFVHSINGRSPLQRVGDKFCFMDREGKTINIHEIAKNSQFKAIESLKGHEMIVNALSCATEPQVTIFSGGYDKIVKRWDVLSLTCTGSAQTETVINALAADKQGNVYVAGAFGYIAKISFQ